jgi:transposase
MLVGNLSLSDCLNRLERVGETMRAALNEWAVMAPDWLQALAPAEWHRRYGRRVENYHLPKTDAAREELARVVAADGEELLAAVDAATDQPVLAQVPAVVTSRRVRPTIPRPATAPSATWTGWGRRCT